MQAELSVSVSQTSMVGPRRESKLFKSGLSSVASARLDAEDDVLLREIQQCLRLRPRRLPCRLFYDETGFLLFEEICLTEEYYLTRTEASILRDHAAEMAALVGPDALLIEFGSGNSHKTRILLDHVTTPVAYVPVEISETALRDTLQRLRLRYPALPVLPVCTDYTQSVRAPRPPREPRRTVVFFPGSTIGNHSRSEACSFLERIRWLCGKGGGLLMGMDLEKEPALIERAYNDACGLTAAFNRNLLRHLNRRIGADFDLERFRHVAFYNQARKCLEMHLESTCPQVVHLGTESFAIAPGERIHTEDCFKYSLEDAESMARATGFRPVRAWTDSQEQFAVCYWEAA